MNTVLLFSDNALSQLNAEVTELRHIMEVILDANRFSQPSTSHQTITSSGTSGNCMQLLPKIGSHI